MNFNKKFLISFLILILSSFSFTKEAFAGRKIEENCYVNKNQDKNVGFTCYSYEEDLNGHYISKTQIEENLTRLGFYIKNKINVVYKETVKGIPVDASATVNKHGNISTYKAKIDDKSMEVKKESSTENYENQSILENTILFPYSVRQKISQNISKKNIEFSTLNFLDGFREVGFSYKFLNEEQLPEFKDEKVRKYSVQLDFAPNMEIYEWFNSKGKLLKRKNITFATEDVFIDKSVLTGLLLRQHIKAGVKLPPNSNFSDIKNSSQILYKVETKANEPSSLFVKNNRQSIIQLQGGTVYLKVLNEKENLKLTAKQTSKYLSSNSFINPSEPSLLKVAKDYGAKYTNKQVLASQLSDYISQNYAKSSLFAELRPLNVVINSKKANQVEYSMLLTSLLRAAKIPAVVVVGVEYLDFPEPSMVYSSWVKAYINNEWVYLTPFDNSQTIGAQTVAMAEVFFAKNNDKNYVLTILPAQIKTMNVEILNYTVNKKKSSVDEGTKKISPVKISDAEEAISSKKMENINLKKATKRELISVAEDMFGAGKIDEMVKIYNMAYKTVSSNSEFSDILFAKKVAKLGLFNLSKNILGNIYDTLTWEKQVETLEKIYYPQISSTDVVQTSFAKAHYLLDVKNKPDDAIDVLNNNTGVMSDYAYYLIALAQLKKNDFKNAEKSVSHAILINNKNLGYKFLKSKILFEQQKYKKALKLLEEINKEKIYDEEFKNEVQARIYLNKSYLAKDEANKNILKARYYFAKKDTEKASDLIKKQEETSEVLSMKGYLEYLSYDVSLAKSNFEKAIKLNPKNIAANEFLGDIYLSENNFNLAQDYFAKGIKYAKTNKQKADLMAKLALAYKHQGDVDDAIKWFEKALKCDKENYFVYDAYGNMLFDLNKNKESVNYLKKSVSINPLYTRAWANLAKGEIKRNNYFLAMEYVASIRLIAPQSDDYFYVAGLMAQYNGNSDKALRFFRQAIILNPANRAVKTELERLEEL